MAIFVELTVDPFIERFSKTKDEKSRRTKGAGLTRVRRPLRGLEIKDDTYAYIKLIRADGSEVSVMDGGSIDGTTKEYSNFILQSVQEQRMERHQILETFGETYVFLFGSAPHMLSCSAVLINSHDFNWKDEFMENYQNYMRGTKALEQGARTYLFYDQSIVEGYMLNASVSTNASEPMMAQLQFQFFVTNAQSIAMLGDPMFPVRQSTSMPPGVSLVENWSGEVMELVLDQTMEGAQYWINQKGWERSRPLREKTYAIDRGTGLMASDEYTGPIQGGEELDAALLIRELEDLDQELEKALAAARQEREDNASIWEKLGLVPHWKGNGVSFGNGSSPLGGTWSWGSVPGSGKIGGFVGKSASIPDFVSDVGSTLKGLPGPLGQAGTAIVNEVEKDAAYVKGQVNKGSDWAKGKVNSAYASAKDWTETAANDALKQAAKAGGYLGVNDYLSWVAKNVPVQVNADMNSAGASSKTQGSPVPFAYTSMKGNLLDGITSSSWKWGDTTSA